MQDPLKIEKNKKDFPPGSEIAIKNGCLCNPEKNNHGKGYNNRNYWWLINTDCKLHYYDSELDIKRKSKSK